MIIDDSFLQTITDFGDSEVLTFATLCASAVLFVEGQRQAALRFFLIFFMAAALIAICKIFFLGCTNVYSERLHIYSPSGHAALTTAFCGALAAYLSTRRRQAEKTAIWGAATLITFSISASRVLLGYHSKPEILVGFTVGCLSLWAIRRLIPVSDDQYPSNRKHLSFFIACIAGITIIIHGHHFPAEHVIRFVARHLHRYVPFCGYTTEY